MSVASERDGRCRAWSWRLWVDGAARRGEERLARGHEQNLKPLSRGEMLTEDLE
jgi:hypothetical protein